MIEQVEILSIKSEDFCGDVYNMELESSQQEDDLFWFNHDGIASHNCFPKDTNAIIYLAETMGVDPKLLKTVIEKNNYIRKNRDWEGQKGRAVI